ncbi:MAB_1171c family putative transporter [Streptomyces bugieae]|uniref:MAB_1171c family putative transporter n=1 Tax=Streptomyces bugieae TaxID=3098223 RepID=A0ABU7NWY2_9ACTN|nr:MAB_1171c family putative transporter [Streptomyces sp. DSM 41528]
MSTLSLYQLGSDVELLGAAALWVVIILRLPAARHSHQQKMLLLAVVGIAGSITVYLDPVTAALNQSFTFAQSCGLFMNAWGVLSSALILDFVLAAMSRRHPWLIYGPMTVTIGALIALNFTIAPHAGCVTTQAVPWYSPFWWILVAAHLVGTIPCAVLCVRYGRQAHDDRPLRTGLLLLAAGFTSSSLFWCVVFAFLLMRPVWLGALFPMNIGVTAWLMTAGVALPLALTIRRTVRDARALWRLSPLWRDLTEAVPHVTLEGPHCRIRAVVGSPQAVRLRLYRQVIEILDVLLVLQDYVRPEMVERARRHLTEHGVAEEHLEPAVTACWLHSALAAVAAADAAQPNPLTPVNLKDDGLRSETDFLLAVLRARTLPAVRSFTPTTATTTPPAGPAPAVPEGRDHHAPTNTPT